MTPGSSSTSYSVRSAEASRTSSCSFAEELSKLCISTYKLHCPINLQDSYKQTVLSAFVIQRNDSSDAQRASNCDGYQGGSILQVVSLGVGTKVLNHDKVIEEFKISQVTGFGGRLVRDCHAEVLARRGLLRFFLSEIKEFFPQYESSCNEKLYAGNESRGCGEEENLNKVEGHSRDTVSEMSRAEEQCKKIDACDTYQRILQVDQQTCKSSATSCTLNISISPLSTPITAQLAHPIAFNPSIFTLNSSTGLLSLKDGISLHMYSSSQPCGNATIKKWARAKKAQSFPMLSSQEYPPSAHRRLEITARAEGQISLLLKRNGCITYTTKSVCTDPPKGNTDSELPLESSRIPVQEPSVDQRVDPPVGTVYPPNSTRTEVEYLKRAKVSASCTDAPQYMSKTTQAVKKEPSRQDSLRQELFGQELLKQEAVREESGGAVGNDMGSVMTCSDKIAKWNALGVQGGLLSILLEPIYITTLTVGRKYSGIHLERALCCRLQDFTLKGKDKGKKQGEDKGGKKGKEDGKEKEKEREREGEREKGKEKDNAGKVKITSKITLSKEITGDQIEVESDMRAEVTAESGATDQITGFFGGVGSLILEDRVEADKVCGICTVDIAPAEHLVNRTVSASVCVNVGVGVITDGGSEISTAAAEEREREGKREESHNADTDIFKQMSPNGSNDNDADTEKVEVTSDAVRGVEMRSVLYFIHHPSMLCCSTKFDTSAITTHRNDGYDEEAGVGEVLKVGVGEGDGVRVVEGKGRNGGSCGTPKHENNKEFSSSLNTLINRNQVSSTRHFSGDENDQSVINQRIKTAAMEPPTWNNEGDGTGDSLGIVDQKIPDALGAIFQERKCFCWWKEWKEVGSDAVHARDGIREKGKREDGENKKITSPSTRTDIDRDININLDMDKEMDTAATYRMPDRGSPSTHSFSPSQQHTPFSSSSSSSIPSSSISSFSSCVIDSALGLEIVRHQHIPRGLLGPDIGPESVGQIPDLDQDEIENDNGDTIHENIDCSNNSSTDTDTNTNNCRNIANTITKADTSSNTNNNSNANNNGNSNTNSSRRDRGSAFLHEKNSSEYTEVAAISSSRIFSDFKNILRILVERSQCSTIGDNHLSDNPLSTLSNVGIRHAVECGDNRSNIIYHDENIHSDSGDNDSGDDIKGIETRLGSKKDAIEAGSDEKGMQDNDKGEGMGEGHCVEHSVSQIGTFASTSRENKKIGDKNKEERKGERCIECDSRAYSSELLTPYHINTAIQRMSYSDFKQRLFLHARTHSCRTYSRPTGSTLRLFELSAILPSTQPPPSLSSSLFALSSQSSSSSPLQSQTSTLILSSYSTAKQILFTDPRFFPDWVRKSDFL